MSSEKPSASPLMRQLWILFSDVNTRFNLLADECAHLQNTIFGYLEKTTNPDLGTDKTHRNDERRWFQPDLRGSANDEKYYLLSAQERALRNLWNSLGSLAHGLENEQKNIKTRFDQVISAEGAGRRNGPELYWFSSVRLKIEQNQLVISVWCNGSGDIWLQGA